MKNPDNIIQSKFIKSQLFTLKAHQDIYKTLKKTGPDSPSHISRFNYIELKNGEYRLDVTPYAICLTHVLNLKHPDEILNNTTPIITTYSLLYQLNKVDDQLAYAILFNTIMQNVEDIFGKTLDEIFEGNVSYIQ